MPFAISYPFINGHRYSWASIEVRILDRIFFGFSSINYSGTLEPADVYGTGSKKIGRTRGRETFDGSMEMYRLEFENLKIALAALNNSQGFGEVPFDIIVAYAETGVVVTDTIIGARIVTPGSDNSEGTDASVISCDLSIMDILWNGTSLTSPLRVASSL